MNASPKTLADVKAGDEIVWHQSRRDDPESHGHLIVERVGRKWGYVKTEFGRSARFYLSDGNFDDWPYGKVYRNIEALKRDIAKTKALNAWRERWDMFRKMIGRRWQPPTSEEFAEIKAAFDRAEAALRELGEWTEPA